MAKEVDNKEVVNREEDYSKWYNNLVVKADLAEQSAIAVQAGREDLDVVEDEEVVRVHVVEDVLELQELTMPLGIFQHFAVRIFLKVFWTGVSQGQSVSRIQSSGDIRVTTSAIPAFL